MLCSLLSPEGSDRCLPTDSTPVIHFVLWAIRVQELGFHILLLSSRIPQHKGFVHYLAAVGARVRTHESIYPIQQMCIHCHADLRSPGNRLICQLYRLLCPSISTINYTPIHRGHHLPLTGHDVIQDIDHREQGQRKRYNSYNYQPVRYQLRPPYRVVRSIKYDRFDGEKAYRQLAELYRAVRLYVNFFQPWGEAQAEDEDQQSRKARIRRGIDSMVVARFIAVVVLPLPPSRSVTVTTLWY